MHALVWLPHRRLSGHDGTVDGSPRKEKSALARFLLTPTAGSDDQQQLDHGARARLLRWDAEAFALSPDTRADVEAGRGFGRPERRASRQRWASRRPRLSGVVIGHAGCPPLPRKEESALAQFLQTQPRPPAECDRPPARTRVIATPRLRPRRRAAPDHRFDPAGLAPPSIAMATSESRRSRPLSIGRMIAHRSSW
jgi:hypothetical protein